MIVHNIIYQYSFLSASSCSISLHILSQAAWLIWAQELSPHNATLVSPNQNLAGLVLQISHFPVGPGQPFVIIVSLIFLPIFAFGLPWKNLASQHYFPPLQIHLLIPESCFFS